MITSICVAISSLGQAFFTELLTKLIGLELPFKMTFSLQKEIKKIIDRNLKNFFNAKGLWTEMTERYEFFKSS